MLKAAAVPWLFMGIVALGMLVFPGKVGFLVRY
jgi:hypothetical protein